MAQVKAGDKSVSPVQLSGQSRLQDIGQWDKETLSCVLNERGLTDIAAKFLNKSISGAEFKFCYIVRE